MGQHFLSATRGVGPRSTKHNPRDCLGHPVRPCLENAQQVRSQNHRRQRDGH